MGKEVGSPVEPCPLKKAGRCKMLVVVVDDDSKAAVTGVKVSVVDSASATVTGTTDGDGHAKLDVANGGVTGTIELSDDLKAQYHDHAAESRSASPDAEGLMTFCLKPLVKVVTPHLKLDKDEGAFDPGTEKSEVVTFEASLTHSIPDRPAECDAELDRSGIDLNVYKDEACTQNIFMGRTAKLLWADLKSPLKLYAKADSADRFTLTLTPKKASTEKSKVKIEDPTTVALAFVTPAATATLGVVAAKFTPGGKRKLTIPFTTDDENKILKELVLEAVDGTAKVTEIGKVTLPSGFKDGGYSLDWTALDGEDPVPPGNYTLRLTATDRFSRKGTDEKPTKILKSGAIHGSVIHGAQSKRVGTDTVELKDVELKIHTGETNKSIEDGSAKFHELEPGDYTIEAALTAALALTYELIITKKTTTIAEDGTVSPIEFHVEPLATIKLTVKSADGPVEGAKVTLGGAKDATKSTDDKGLADFGVMPVGDYTVDVAYVASSDNEKSLEVPAQGTFALTRNDQLKQDVTVVVMPALDVAVQCASPAKKLKDVSVKLTHTPSSKVFTVKTVDVTGLAAFPHLPAGEYKLDLTYEGDDVKNYEVPAQETFTVTAGPKNVKSIDVEPKKCPVYLKPAFKLPDDSEHALPKDLKLTLSVEGDTPTTGTTIDCKLNDKGVLVLAADDKVVKVARIRKFSVSVPKADNTFVVFEKAGETTLTQELIVDAAPDDTAGKIGVAAAAGKRAFMWAQEEWKLTQLDVAADPATHFTAGTATVKYEFDFKTDETIGTDAAPVKLLIKPKWQYLRLEYFDRRHGKAKHAEKRISIPPVLVLAARKHTDGVMASVEAAAVFPVDAADNAKACLAVPWIVTKKKDDGTVLPKLDKGMHLEINTKDAWVEATSDTVRKIVKLDPVADKLKIAAHKDRDKYYDLPKTWKNVHYYTRLSATTGKFFDELSETEIEASYAKDKPLTFSLDDIVLVDGSGGQEVKDRDRNDTETDRSEHSRFAILHFDPAAKFEIAVWDFRADAVYHSKGGFVKDGASVYRNYIIAYPINPRVVTFCNGFHDIADKRTTGAVFAKKHVWGARAAKLDDADVSAKRRFNDPGDTTAGYVHRTRVADLHYVHGGAFDGTTVYSGLVTHYSQLFFSKRALRPTTGWHAKKAVSDDITDTRNYRGAGMKNAMDRWNGKKYQFEQLDQGKDIVVKQMMYFEAKAIEHPASSGTFKFLGGKHHSLTSIGTDENGSSATDTDMFMRRSGYTFEGSNWGDAPTTETREKDYDGGDSPRSALAHELGHAAVGLWDDYITQTQFGVPSFKDVQRYPGVPYYRDKASIMSSNQAARLRTMYGRARWLNDESQTTKALHKFLDGKKFAVTYEAAGKDKLRYFLPDGVKNFWLPARSALGHNLGLQGVADLHLYALGADEFSAILPDGPYDSFLVVDTRLELEFVKGLSPAAVAWAATQVYAVGNTVEESSEFYVCVGAHTSQATFAADSAKWLKLQVGNPVNVDRVVNDKCRPGDWVKDGGTMYVGLLEHWMGDIDKRKFVEVVPAAPTEWTTGTAYTVGQLAVDTPGGGLSLLCKTAHTAGATRGGEWIDCTAALSGGTPGDYAPDVDYAVGDFCMDNGKTYACQTGHRSGAVALDVELKRLAPCDAGPAWTATEKNDWVANASKAITQAIEGPKNEGKFRFTCTAGDYKKVYVRPFPQFCDPSLVFKANGVDLEPVTGGTPHYKLKITKSTTDSFTPDTVDAKKLGLTSATNLKTLTRYIYGRLSEVATTRATQTPTAPLALTDLDTMKAWVDGTAKAENLDEIPKITGLATPAGTGIGAVGATLTITGSKLASATKVSFGAIDAALPLASNTDGTITVVIPATAITANIKVTTAKGTGTSAQAFKVIPKITALAPTTAVAIGAEITITGTTFTNATEVKINTTVAEIASNTATEIKVKVPAGATTGKVTVTTSSGSGLSATDLTVLPLPTLDRFEPAAAAVGADVSIHGTNLADTSAVMIGGVAATIVSKVAALVVAKVGASAANGEVTVTTPGGVAKKPGFTVVV